MGLCFLWGLDFEMPDGDVSAMVEERTKIWVMTVMDAEVEFIIQ